MGIVPLSSPCIRPNHSGPVTEERIRAWADSRMSGSVSRYNLLECLQCGVFPQGEVEVDGIFIQFRLVCPVCEKFTWAHYDPLDSAEQWNKMNQSKWARFFSFFEGSKTTRIGKLSI